MCINQHTSISSPVKTFDDRIRIIAKGIQTTWIARIASMSQSLVTHPNNEKDIVVGMYVCYEQCRVASESSIYTYICIRRKGRRVSNSTHEESQSLSYKSDPPETIRVISVSSRVTRARLEIGTSSSHSLSCPPKRSQ